MNCLISAEISYRKEERLFGGYRGYEDDMLSDMQNEVNEEIEKLKIEFK